MVGEDRAEDEMVARGEVRRRKKRKMVDNQEWEGTKEVCDAKIKEKRKKKKKVKRKITWIVVKRRREGKKQDCIWF